MFVIPDRANGDCCVESGICQGIRFVIDVVCYILIDAIQL